MPCVTDHEGGWLSPVMMRATWEAGKGRGAQRHASVSEAMVMRWTTPQHPCCNPARLVLPPRTWTLSRATSPIRDVDAAFDLREDLPPAALDGASPHRPRPGPALPSLLVVARIDRGGLIPCQVVEPHHPAPSPCLTFPNRLALRQLVIFFLLLSIPEDPYSNSLTVCFSEACCPTTWSLSPRSTYENLTAPSFLAWMISNHPALRKGKEG